MGTVKFKYKIKKLLIEIKQFFINRTIINKLYIKVDLYNKNKIRPSSSIK